MDRKKIFKILTVMSAIMLVACHADQADPTPVQLCTTAIYSIIQAPNTTANEVNVQSSSQGFNNLGDMDRCLDVSTNNFISVYVNNNFNNVYPAPYVLCLPNVCPSSLINNNRQAFNVVLNQLIAKLPFATGQQYSITGVYDGTNDAPSVNGGLVVVSILIAIIGLAGIGGSIVAYRYESAKEKALKKRIDQAQNDNDPPSGAGLSNDAYDEDYLPQETTMTKIGRSFGFIENFNKLFTFKSQGHIDFAIFNGTRFMCMVWIIIGQSFLIRFGSIKNIADKNSIETSAGWSTIAATSQLAVDMFFFISGFLLAAVTLERFANRIEVKVTDLLVFFIHRLIRLWPVYFIVILFYWQIMPYSGDGPMFNQYIDQIQNCDSRAWSSILMIDNLANNGDTQGCFQWGFVISNEIQFYLVGLIVLYIYHLNSKAGIGILLSLFIGSQVASIVIAADNSYVADYFTFSNPDTFYNDFHIKPWVRMGPYFLGALIGIFYRSYKLGNSSIVQFADKVLNNTILRYVLYFVGISLISSMVWCIVPVQHDVTNWSEGGHAVYLAFGRIGFIVGFFFLTLPLLFGKRNLLRGLLGARFWVPLSRVTFCMYLCHQFVIERSLFNQKNIRYFDNQLAFYATISDTIFTLLFGAAFCVFVELPISNLEKLLLISPAKLKGNAQVENEDDFEAIEIKKQMMNH